MAQIVAATPNADADDVPLPSHRMFLASLFACYALIWIVMAISPLSRFDWMVQNMMPAVFAGVLIGSYNRFQFSPLSYLLMTIFMMLHVIGAHYTYAHVPVGNWLRDVLGLSRNCFDRVVHFSFGLLMTHPLREILRRKLRTGRGVFNWLSVTGVLAFSAAWEILESWLAQIISPESGAAYLGAQGDTWDAQNDMAVAFYGSLAWLSLTAVWRYLLQHEFYERPDSSSVEQSRLPT
jgi:putative membrane protein